VKEITEGDLAELPFTKAQYLLSIICFLYFKKATISFSYIHPRYLISSETVEKVPKQILGGDAEKNDLTECATINDLTIMRGHETPKNQPLTILKGFSTVSADIVTIGVTKPGFEILL
jgi:hypothetical protein